MLHARKPIHAENYPNMFSYAGRYRQIFVHGSIVFLGVDLALINCLGSIRLLTKL